MKKIYALIIMVLLSCFAVSTAWAASAPAAPAGLEASAVSSSEIKLIWEDNSDNESGFKIERKKLGDTYRQIAVVNDNITTYTCTGLSSNTKYYFRVRAYNTAGNSAYSNEDSATTMDVTPDAPSALVAETLSVSRIKLNWEDNSDNETGFKIERKKSGGSYTQIAVVEDDITTYTNTGLTNDTKYYYRVRAYNGTGNSAYSNEDSSTTGIIPAVPSDLEAKAVSSSKVELTWEDNSNNETGFKIERKKAGGSYSQIKTVGKNVTTFTDTGLTSNTKYYYRVRAYTSTENSAYSKEVAVTTPKAETIIRLVVEKTTYYVNNTSKTMDTAPIIKDSRTLLPIRFVAEAIGANVTWNNSERKVTITLKGTTIELWIGVNHARVNGEYKFIDSTNTVVTPIIADPGRTMIPLRFVSENLGAKVDWNSIKREVTVTYPAP